MKKKNLEMIIESQMGILHGRVLFQDNLIIDSGGTLQELEDKLKSVIFDFEEVDPGSIQFLYSYDVSSLFQRFDFLKISKVAEYAGMSPTLLRQYACQAKFPSAVQALKIEKTLHQLAEEMKTVSIYTGS